MGKRSNPYPVGWYWGYWAQLKRSYPSELRFTLPTDHQLHRSHYGRDTSE